MPSCWTSRRRPERRSELAPPPLESSGIIFEGNRLEARFVLDCSGRAGLLGRAWREKRPRSATVALCGIWRDEAAWNLPDPSHTLVESYENGWAWSVPVEPSVRYVAFMTDRRRPYLGELAKTRAFREIFSRGTLQAPTWGRDAAVFCSRKVAGPGFLIAGDAAATLDPLSSFGVKKAMASGWVAAVVANTCLRRPEMEAAALQFFEEREREVFESYDRLSAAWYGDEASIPGTAGRARRSARPAIDPSRNRTGRDARAAAGDRWPRNRSAGLDWRHRLRGQRQCPATGGTGARIHAGAGSVRCL